jgi:hypothetical protein
MEGVHMPSITDLDRMLTHSERESIHRLGTPAKIQEFLDELPYSIEPIYRCPLRVLRERVAHCFDGALFGAAMLRLLGHPPLILEMLPNERDDDHLLALYRFDGHWGAVSKSNFVGLRFRDPIYRTLRELVMSYFEQFYNVEHEKTLRGYTLPLHLSAFDPWDWMARDDCLERIAQKLDRIRKVPVLTQPMIDHLSPVDERSYRAGLFGADEAGLYRPVSKK